MYLISIDDTIVSRGKTIKDALLKVFEIKIEIKNGSQHVTIINNNNNVADKIKHSYSLRWTNEEIINDVVNYIKFTNMDILKQVRQKS